MERILSSKFIKSNEDFIKSVLRGGWGGVYGLDCSASLDAHLGIIAIIPVYASKIDRCRKSLFYKYLPAIQPPLARFFNAT
jgi:hypothetical protein